MVSTRAHFNTLGELVQQRAYDMPDQTGYTFLLDGEMHEARLSYGQLARQARAIATRLQDEAGVGERALLLYPPGLEYITAFFGCLFAGVVAVPAYPPDPMHLDHTLPRLQAIIRDANVAFVLTTTPLHAVAQTLFAQMPELTSLTWVTTDNISPRLAEDWRTPALKKNSLAFLQYTSGSTGAAKGVMLTHGNLLHNSKLIYTAFAHSAESRGVIWLPPYHDMGLIGGIIQPLYGGFPVVLMSPLDFLRKPLRWLHAISHYRATTSGGPNFAYDLCVRKISHEERLTLDLSHWAVAFNGAEPVHSQTLERFVHAFGPCGFEHHAFYPCYGLAEATLIVSGGQKSSAPLLCRTQAEGLARHQVVEANNRSPETAVSTLVGCGQALAEQSILIVNPENLETCNSSQIGEIWVAGPSVAQGYWNQPQKTEEMFQAYAADSHEGPFLRTGDLGFLRNGELFITGRLKDLIVIRGQNYYPQDIERTVASSHPALRPGCGVAFSVAHSGTEQLVVVQEMRQEAMGIGFETVVQAIRAAVGYAHALRVETVLFIPPRTIPKTSSGKLQRQACKAAFLNNTLKVVNINAPAILSEIEDEIKTRSGATEDNLVTRLQHQTAKLLQIDVANLDPHQSLLAYGLDSLMAAELQSQMGVFAQPLKKVQSSGSISEIGYSFSFSTSSSISGT